MKIYKHLTVIVAVVHVIKIVLIFNVTSVIGGTACVYSSGAPDITSVLFGAHIASVLAFCIILFQV